ncbi:MAG: hypothetical protein ACTTJS_05955 [Wolinella sp.]
MYTDVGYNRARKFNFVKLEYGNSLYFGDDLSIVLSPKITLDLGIEQRFQASNKIIGKNMTNVRSIPTYNIGSTCSINNDASVSFSKSMGGGSIAPDSVFSAKYYGAKR